MELKLILQACPTPSVGYLNPLRIDQQSRASRRSVSYDGQQTTAVVEAPTLRYLLYPGKLLVAVYASYQPTGHCAGLSSRF